jgi:hypothetical protein
VGRELFLELARRGHRVPIATDLVLRAHADADAILAAGAPLGAVIAEAARAFQTPLALPLMDLSLEKAELLGLLGVPTAEREGYHVSVPPERAETDALVARLETAPPGPDVEVRLEAVRYVARETDLLPIAMCIGPFSLTTKLLADPIPAVYLSGAGRTPRDEAAVALLEACHALAVACVLRQVGLRWRREPGRCCSASPRRTASTSLPARWRAAATCSSAWCSSPTGAWRRSSPRTTPTSSSTAAASSRRRCSTASAVCTRPC